MVGANLYPGIAGKDSSVELVKSIALTAVGVIVGLYAYNKFMAPNV